MPHDRRGAVAADNHQRFATHLGSIGFDAFKLIALAHIERQSARLDLAACPHLRRPAMQTKPATDYWALVPGIVA